jgi:glycerophosphoryl diester phosphodiesterase
VPEIHGHRGARALRPENTIPGLAHALAIGVDALEFDVTRTADGGLILAHDLTVDQQCILSTGPADYAGKTWAELTLEQIATLDAGSRRPVTPYDETFQAVPGTGVPTLDQVCRLITEANAHDVTLSVELKADPSWPDTDVHALTESTLGTLAAHDLTSQSRILAFNWRVLRAAQAIDPAVPRVALVEPASWVPGSAWLAGLDPAAYGAPGNRAAAHEASAQETSAQETSAQETSAQGASAQGASAQGASATSSLAGSAEAARDIGASWLSPWDPLTSAELIAAAHKYGLLVSVWTVNDADRMAELIELGADGIVTDRPDLLRQVLAGRSAPLPPACELPWQSGIPDWAPRVEGAGDGEHRTF